MGNGSLRKIMILPNAAFNRPSNRTPTRPICPKLIKYCKCLINKEKS